MKKRLVLVLLAALLLATGLQAAPTLWLDPLNGYVGGMPGDTVGWGFTIQNDTDYLLVTSAYLSPNFSAVGWFEDYTLAQFIVVGPDPESPSVHQDFDPLSLLGLGAFHIDPAAPLIPVRGTLSVTYNLYSVSPNDPNFDPEGDLITEGGILSARASVLTPEPASLLLFGPALLWFAWRVRRRR